MKETLILFFSGVGFTLLIYFLVKYFVKEELKLSQNQRNRKPNIKETIDKHNLNEQMRKAK